MKLKDYLEKLKAFNWKNYNLYYAVLFGSLAKKGEGNDFDIAVEFKNKEVSLDDYMKLWKDLSDYLDTDKIDLVMINDDTNCYLIHEVFNYGLILYKEDWSIAHRRAVVCEDFLIDAKKLDLVGREVRAVMKKWQS